MNSFLRPIFATVVATLLVVIAALPSDAAQRTARPKATIGFDGLWSVSILTLQGDCEPAYRYPARIVGSRVMQADPDPSYQLYGAVGRSGAIRVIVVRGPQWADGRGHLVDGHGQGRWTTSTGQCAGSWTAVRRG